MDVLFFLRQRTQYIRYFYDAASVPFSDIIRKIEAEEAPFDNPPYSEDGEPAYLEEWSKAADGLQTVGRASVSMLSAALQLYFKTWEDELGIVWESGERKKAFEQGFVEGYRRGFGGLLKLTWNECPVDFAILEQVVLARNSDQHPDKIIMTLSVTHRYKDLKKYPQPFFVSEGDRKRLASPEMADVSWITPVLYVSRETLIAAIEQVEMLGEWLEDRFFAAKYSWRNQGQSG